MLKFEQITKTFKSEFLSQPFIALNNVSFEIPNGSMVGFLGANGAGKTTSLKIIMDFIRPDSGNVSFDTALGNSRIEVLKKIGFLPERPYFYPNLTGEEFIHFMGSLSDMQSSQIRVAIEKWSPRFKIDFALNRPLKTYSKGMLQRIGFMATILHEPELIILDEPLSGLDPIGRKELKDVILEVHRQGKTVFFSSHIVPDIEEICDRVIFLKQGQLVYDGEVDSLIRSTGNPLFQIKFQSDEKIDFQTECQNYHQIPGNIFSLEVTAANKNSLLSEVLAKNGNLVGIDSIKPSLEEIFYQIKSN